MVKNFHKQPLQQRQDQLKKLLPELDVDVLSYGGLTPELADHMIENCIGILPLPLGLGTGFLVNGKNYIVPMAVEEPSVIAACSAIAKIIGEHGGGFLCHSTPPVMIGQIQISEIEDFEKVKYILTNEKRKIIEYANGHCKTMVQRGGGVKDLRWRQLAEDMMVVELLVDVREAMGANIINTISEATAPYINQLLGQGSIGIRILSNLCTDRMTIATFEIPVNKLAWKEVTGELVAKKIVEAYRFAKLDQHRATTHNKGIMNGIDAVAIALGQDWRAIESAAHSFASIKGRYSPLTEFKIVKGVLKARLELPISVGTKGGAIQTNPSYIATHQIMGYPTANEIAQVMASVGLAQNFAALRALSIEGIQRGHMNLHAKNVAIQAGLPTNLVNGAVFFMKTRNRINIKTAQQYMQSHKMFENSQAKKEIRPDISSFFVELFVDFLPEPLILTILLDSKTAQAHHISVEKIPKISVSEPPSTKQLKDILKQGTKGYDWISSFLGLMDTIKLKTNPKALYQSEQSSQKNKISSELIMTQYMLKLLAIQTNILVANLLTIEPEGLEPTNFLVRLVDSLRQKHCRDIKLSLNALSEFIPSSSSTDSVEKSAISYGCSLLKELAFKFLTYTQDVVQDNSLKSLLLTEYGTIIHAQVQSRTLYASILEQKGQPNENLFNTFFRAKQKKMNYEMMLLADCVTLFNASDISTQAKKDLINYIKSIGEVAEVKAVAYHDIGLPANSKAPNLYRAWFISKSGGVGQVDSVVWKSKFIDFIEEYCKIRLTELKVKENPHFDSAQFNEVMLLIESYYKLDNKVRIIQHHKL